MNETFVFDKYGTIFNFILQFYDKFELLNSQRYCGNIHKVRWEIIYRPMDFIVNFLLFPVVKEI